MSEEKATLDEVWNARAAFQLLSSAFVQIDDEDAREILAELANKALSIVRPFRLEATRQQEWRIWMANRDERYGTWRRDYEFHQTK